MVEARQDKTWALLTPEDKVYYRAIFAANLKSSEYDEVLNNALRHAFGLHNLTAKPSEESEKGHSEPMFHVGDKVMVGFLFGIIEEINRTEYPEYPYSVRFADGLAGHYSEADLKPYNVLKEESTAKSEIRINPPIDYAQYRLDLAKEIALKVINNKYFEAARIAVDTANEIVKRLKETENGN